VNENSVILILIAVLSGGTIGSILTFFNGRRQGKTSQMQASTSHMEVVTDTLAEFNDRLNKQVKELQEQNELLRKELEAERALRRKLEDRVAQLERESKLNG
jgi:predicted RNase H-like nuclease (RuvC/YqgF family)